MKYRRCWFAGSPDTDWLETDKLLAYALLPWTSLLVVGALVITLLCRKMIPLFFKMMYGCFSAVYFILYIEVLFQVFAAVNCYEFLDETVMRDDLIRICFEKDSDQLNFLMFFAAPTAIGIFAWQIFSFCKMRKNKE